MSGGCTLLVPTANALQPSLQIAPGGRTVKAFQQAPLRDLLAFQPTDWRRREKR